MHVFIKWMMFLCFSLSLPAFAEGVHGILRVVKGEVKIKSAKTNSEVRARIGEKVFPKDVIITGKDARAKIVMVDNNEINVSPESQIEIQNYEYDPSAGKKEVLLNVIYGKVRSKVEQKYDGKTSKFQIKTPSAVAGVRGTDFLTSYTPSNNQSSVVTFHGKVEFGLPGPNNTIASPVFVTPGTQASNTGSAAPSAPTPVSKQELAKMDNESKSPDRSPSNTAPGGGPGNENGNGNGKGNDGDKAKGPDGEKGKGPDGDKAKGSGSREPSSTSGSGMILKDSDVPGGSEAPKTPGNNQGPLGPPIPTINEFKPPAPPPPCVYCNDAIQSGKTNLIIKVNGQ